MDVLRSIDELPAHLRHGAVAIGNFDGVHLGHARIVELLRNVAGEVGGPAIVFTFDPHPVRLLRPELAPPPLTWTDRKAELLAQLGVDAMIAYPTDEALLALSPDEFFHTIVREKMDARAMIEGPNFYFGRNRGGDIKKLDELCAANNVRLEIVEPMRAGDAGEFVSSSRIRRLIAAGDVDAARMLLTQPYRLRGMVTHGAARGAKIGFPTANVDAIDTILPGMGVYAGRAYVATPQGQQAWPAAINVGPSPTFGVDEVRVEVHLIGFAGSLYGQPLEVDFISRLRDIQPFAGVDALVTQLRRDVEAARQRAADEEHEIRKSKHEIRNKFKSRKGE
jgi:riboflavin kinase/FMN adenylyltransferase